MPLGVPQRVTEAQLGFPSPLWTRNDETRVSESLNAIRAIAKNPAVLLCDEPTGALDSTTGVVVLEALERANRDLGATTVIITHNADIARMADRVLQLRDGCIVSEVRNETKTAARDIVW